MIRPGFTTATHSSGLPLPLPIRVSAGFFVTGLSGKIRIHILPPRLRLRVSATRAASICRLVTQPGSSAFSPYSPNASVAPRCAVPRIRPRWAFRYLTRLGISTRGVLSRFRRRGAQHFALEDPDLHADRSVCRVGGRESVVDVCANRVQRHAAVAVPLLACDLAATQPPRTRDPDAVGAQAQCGGDRLLHGAANRARITIATARPGIIIGRKGSEVEKLKNELQARTGKEIYLNIEEVIHPELDAQLVAENVALQLQKRVAFRRAMKKAVTSALRLGADGIRIACAGRLGCGEVARREWYRDGRVPLHTIRADIDYGHATGPMTYGKIGGRVWVFKGEMQRAAPAEA